MTFGALSIGRMCCLWHDQLAPAVRAPRVVPRIFASALEFVPALASQHDRHDYAFTVILRPAILLATPAATERCLTIPKSDRTRREKMTWAIHG